MKNILLNSWAVRLVFESIVCVAATAQNAGGDINFDFTWLRTSNIYTTFKCIPEWRPQCAKPERTMTQIITHILCVLKLTFSLAAM